MNQYSIELKGILMIVDVQGFLIDGVFHAREGCLYSKNFKINVEINPSITYQSLSNHNKQMVKYFKDNFHGFNFHPKRWEYNQQVLNEKTFLNLVHQMYKINFTNEKNKIAFKNPQIRTFLERLSLPLINLDNKIYNIPSINSLNNYYSHKIVHCNFHSNVVSIYDRKCSLKKCFYLYTYIKYLLRN